MLAKTPAAAAVPSRPRHAHPLSTFRSLAAQRRKRLVAEYVAALGGPKAVDAAMLDKVKRAAELVVVAELARDAVLRSRGESGLDNLVRIERLAELAVRRLHLERKRGPSETTLNDYLREAAE